jgi:hypothetical protein
VLSEKAIDRLLDCHVLLPSDGGRVAAPECSDSINLKVNKLTRGLQVLDLSTVRQHGERGALNRPAREVEDAVLVDVAERVQDPQRIGLRIARSVVRLRLLDECLLCWRDAPGLVEAATSCRLAAREPVVSAAVREDGELGSARRGAVEARELPSEMIQARAKGVETVPDDRAQSGGSACTRTRMRFSPFSGSSSADVGGSVRRLR